MTNQTASNLGLSVDQINKAAKEGRAFVDSGYGDCFISEYTYAGLVTFSDGGYKSTIQYGTGRIMILSE